MTVCLICSVIIAALFLCVSVRKKNRKRNRSFIKPLHILVVGCFISSLVFFLPINWVAYQEKSGDVFLTFLISAHNTLRLFVLDGEFDFVSDFVGAQSGWVAIAFQLYGALLYISAPVLTFSVVLSFIRDLTSYRKLLTHYSSDVYFFSELNLRSLSLAKSIRRKDKKAMLVFADVFESNEESSYEMVESAHELGAVLFRDDLRKINHTPHGSNCRIVFFIIGDKVDENIAHLADAHARYAHRKNTTVYLFSEGIISELALCKYSGDALHVQTFSEKRAVIYDLMYSHGEELFKNAVQAAGGTKHISVIVLGLGEFGFGIIKTLSWMCQMYGYTLTVYGFDRQLKKEAELAYQCPELLDERFNGPGKEYDIRLYSGISAESSAFTKIFNTIPHVTQVYVSLGSDEDNVRVSVQIRMLCQRKKQFPKITTVIYDSHVKEALFNACNYREQAYDIDYVGDVREVYSERLVFHSELEKDALSRHLKWGKEDEFWKYPYNYWSSAASAIHMKLREFCKMPGAGKKESELTLEERDQLEVLEHRRWNAYMRSEGYVYSGSTEKASRDDLAKIHNNLVPFEELSAADKRKDSKVGSL